MPLFYFFLDLRVTGVASVLSSPQPQSSSQSFELFAAGEACLVAEELSEEETDDVDVIDEDEDTPRRDD